MKKLIHIMWYVYGALVTICVLGVVSIKQGWIGYMPPLDELNDPIDKYASQIFSADGKMLGTWSQKENRIFVPKDSISPHMFEALVATEDSRFYDHCGIDGRALLRAIVKRGFMGQRSAGGGSTITQQLAKQLYSSTASNTLQRLFQKPIEWVIAVELERHYTKEEIITLYLNYFDFLHNAVGIKTAAKVYFNKSPKDLSVSECAMLVGMCKNPAYFNPVREPERVQERRNVVLDLMVKGGYISVAESESLKSTDLGLHFRRIDHKDGQAAYLREYLRRIMMAEKPQRKDYMAWQEQQYYQDSLSWEKDPLYGWCKKNSKRDGSNYNIYTDGLRIITTIDSRMQQDAEEAVYGHVANYLQKQFNKEKRGSANFPYTSSISQRQLRSILARSEQQSDRYRAMKAAGASDEEIRKAFHTRTDMTVFSYHGEIDTVMTPLDSIKYYKSFLRAGLVSIEPQSGYVKAYVGGLDFTHFQYDMAMVGRRQVGSTMKPFVYAMAMEDGLEPNYMVPNVQRSYGSWTPRNGSRRRYGEQVPLSWGLAQSNNWVTANLMAQVDPSGHRLIDFLREGGISTYKLYPSMVLCLGPCEITVGELASAYTMFVNKGIRCAPLLVSRIEDSQGNILAEFTPRMNEVISEQSSYNMLRMLEGVVNSGTAGRLHYKFKLEGPLAGKTGTTNNNADGWFVGIVPRLVTACWVGGEDRDIHFNSTAMGQGAETALPIFAYYLTKIYRNPALGYSPKEKFPYEQLTKSVGGREKTSSSISDDSSSDNAEEQNGEKSVPAPHGKSQVTGEHLFD
ncbi:transglycosylase domain-containing protein [Alloprevotella rava]|uniref:Penicillin-binding protein 1A n=1 Tax=Alloprevotella rava TaxID=671218 RepID=A0A7W5XXZ9_9BACT|nr:transglycosylase domain-containing protein [Alloprevotella rava]MBB3702998.1 penicillin-binding protein 1A [Alloprevotella rava]